MTLKIERNSGGRNRVVLMKVDIPAAAEILSLRL